jgi:hypothetical protein
MGRGRVVYGLGRKRVRFLAVVTLKQVKRPRTLARRIKAVGL